MVNITGIYTYYITDEDLNLSSSPPPLDNTTKFVYHSFGKSSTIDKLLTLDEILSIIKNGDKNLSDLLFIRKLGKNHPKYIDLKITLPTVRFNFSFKHKVSNENIIGSTGYIYIDVDNNDNINLSNPLIVAAWKSLSNTGYGILVRVNGLTTDNFYDSYDAISKELGLSSDVGARKPTQPNILSYDPNIYINYDYIVFEAIEKVSSVLYKEDFNKKVSSVLYNENINKKVSSVPIQYDMEKVSSILYNENINKKVSSALYNETIINNELLSFDNNINSVLAPQGLEREKTYQTNDTFLKSSKIRFSNIDEYFVGENYNKKYIVFDTKELICNPFIPRRIPAGKRNIIMYYNLSMYALLNPNCDSKLLIACGNSINKNFIEKYTLEKIISIVNAILKKRENNTLEMFKNQERLILFNPKYKLTREEKYKIIGGVMGKRKIDKTQSELYIIIEQWDFVNNGKISQIKVAEELKKTIITVKRHWHVVKDLVKQMNADFKNGVKYYDLKNEIFNDKTISIQHGIIQPEPAIEVVKEIKIEVANELKEVEKNKLIFEFEMANESTYEEFYNSSNTNKYSKIEFELLNGCIVYVPTIFTEEWGKIAPNSIRMNGFRKNENQHQFDKNLFSWQLLYKII
ncbi:hypothetical protein [Flavobacterium gilvum]|uniref:hypothetical protein n=1 Tax=Flavobacterium gilvum TaxID=1492737 RepID=UPI000AFE7DE0|nr:hypothetical protein [Flavobacterium gilvum]